MKRTIWVTFQKEGIHHYSEAAIREDLKSVNFIGTPHRHIFHFKVWLSVEHNNRDIEFIMLKRKLESLYSSMLDINYKSCEMLAEDLIDIIHNELYPEVKYIKVSVSEDNENGAELEQSYE